MKYLKCPRVSSTLSPKTNKKSILPVKCKNPPWRNMYEKNEIIRFKNEKYTENDSIVYFAGTRPYIYKICSLCSPEPSCNKKTKVLSAIKPYVTTGRVVEETVSLIGII
jgi:hypothetical protein